MRSLLLLAAWACTLGVAPAASASLRVFACEPEWAALVRELGGEALEVYSASTAHQDVHKLQPRPSLIARYRQADLAVCTGADLEAGWLPALIQKANNPRLRPGQAGFFEAAQHVRMLDVPERLDRAMGDLHAYGNPHVHTDPRNIAAVATALVERLAALDPANASAHRARGADFQQRWSAALADWTAKAAPLRGQAVVSRHGNWRYLIAWLQLREIATLEPKPGIPPSAGHLEAVLGRLEREPARMIIHAAYEDRRAADWLAARSSLPVVELPYTVGGAPGADDLFGLFDVTVARLLAAQAGAP